jgi:hypothetical protein
VAIAYKSAGTGVASETSGFNLQPACPTVVDAGDILIIHAYFEGTATTPSTPAGFTLLHGPEVIETTIGRHWIYGKIAAGTEDSASNSLGSAAVTTMRSARCYSFSGRVSGTITDLVVGFAATSHATDPQMPSVTTTVAGARAVACVVQNDNNALAAATGMSGGTWTEAVAEFVSPLTPGLVLQLQTCIPTADPGTVSGGSVAATNDPSGVIGFEIRPSAPSATTLVADSANVPITGTNASLAKRYPLAASAGSVPIGAPTTTLGWHHRLDAQSGSVPIDGTAATLARRTTLTASSGSVAISGTAATLLVHRVLAAAAGSVPIAGTAASLEKVSVVAAASGSIPITGTAATLKYNRRVNAASGSMPIAGTNATLLEHERIAADSGSVPIAGTAAALKHHRRLDATAGTMPIAGADASLSVSGDPAVFTLTAEPGAVPITGTSAALERGLRVDAQPGAIAITGIGATLRHNKRLDALAGNVPITGQSVNLSYVTEFASLDGSTASLVEEHRATAVLVSVDDDLDAPSDSRASASIVGEGRATATVVE